MQGKQALVKNADLRHPSCAVVMEKRKFASPVLNVLSKAAGAEKRHLGTVCTELWFSAVYTYA